MIVQFRCYFQRGSVTHLMLEVLIGHCVDPHWPQQQKLTTYQPSHCGFLDAKIFGKKSMRSSQSRCVWQNPEEASSGPMERWEWLMPCGEKMLEVGFFCIGINVKYWWWHYNHYISPSITMNMTTTDYTIITILLTHDNQCDHYRYRLS